MKYGKYRSDLYKKVSAVASVAIIPEIMAQSDLIEKILHTDYIDNTIRIRKVRINQAN